MTNSAQWGRVGENLKDACNNFHQATGIKVTIRERAGNSLKSDAEPEPLRNKSCGRASKAAYRGRSSKKC